MNNEEYKVDSMDEIEFVTRKWKDIEQRIEYIAVKVAQLTNDGETPVNFVINIDRHEVVLIYESEKLRVFPLEIVLIVPDEGMVEELIKPWLDFRKQDDDGNLVIIPKEEEGK